MMRIVTGSAKGKKLVSLEGDATRPTSERIKEAIFSSIQFDVEGRRVLDLFAGSGQMGLEAISRGAESAVFIDNSKKSLDVVKHNLAAAKLEDRAKVIETDYLSYVSMTPDRFDIVFMDPPYSTGLLENAIQSVTRVLTDYAIILCEHPVDQTMPEAIGSFKHYKMYRFGKLAFTIYRPAE